MPTAHCPGGRCTAATTHRSSARGEPTSARRATFVTELSHERVFLAIRDGDPWLDHEYPVPLASDLGLDRRDPTAGELVDSSVGGVRALGSPRGVCVTMHVTGEPMSGGAAAEFLLVQDDAVDEIYTREALNAYKVVNRVHAVRDVRQACAFLDREPPYADAPAPDIVLLDLNLPGHDGRFLLRHLRTRADTAQVPVMLLVDSPVAERILRREDLPVQGYLPKPVDFGCLTTVVQALSPMAFVVLRRS